LKKVLVAQKDPDASRGWGGKKEGRRGQGYLLRAQRLMQNGRRRAENQLAKKKTETPKYRSRQLRETT